MPLLLASLAACSSPSVGLVENHVEVTAPIAMESNGQRWWPMRGFLKPHAASSTISETEDSGLQGQQLTDSNEEDLVSPKHVRIEHVGKNLGDGINNSKIEETGSVDAKQLDSIEKVASNWAKVDGHGEKETPGLDDDEAGTTKSQDRANTHIETQIESKSHRANSSEAGVQQQDPGLAESPASLSNIGSRERSLKASGSEGVTNNTATIHKDDSEAELRHVKELVARIAQLQQNAPPDSELSRQVQRLQVVAARISDLQDDSAESQSRTDIKHLAEIAQKATELERQIAEKVNDLSASAVGSTTSEHTVAVSEDVVLTGESGDAAANALQSAISDDAVITGESG